MLGRPSQPNPYLRGDLSITYGERIVTVTGRPVELTPTEYSVLLELSVNAGIVLTHEQLLRRDWGVGNSSDSGLVRTIVNKLSRNIGDAGRNLRYIFTVPRVGYCMARAKTRGEADPSEESVTDCDSFKPEQASIPTLTHRRLKVDGKYTCKSVGKGSQ